MEFFENLLRSHARDRLTRLTVLHSSEKNCWVALPPALISKLYSESHDLPLVLELRTVPDKHDRASAQSWHVAWSGSASKGQHIEVPAALAGCLGIAQGISVTAEAVADVPEATGVCVEPISSDDWEVVEQNAGHMEDHILTQIKLLLKVTTAHPGSLVRLVAGSEVAVAPRPRRHLGQQAVITDADLKQDGEEDDDHADTWLRLQGANEEAVPLQCRLTGTGEASVSGFEGHTPLSTCICISKHTARQARLSAADLVLVSKSDPRATKHVLSINISSKVAPGHAQLPQSVLQSLKLQQHGQVRLQSITTANQIHPTSITLHPMPHPATADSNAPASAIVPQVVEELSPQDLKQVFSAWLAAQASTTDESSQHSGDDHVPVQQGTVVQLDAAEGSDSHLQSTVFQIQMKQPLSLLQKPAANYALLSASDLDNNKVTVAQGDMIAGVKATPAGQDAVQLPAEQLAMLGSSAAMHAAAHKALQHLLPMLAFPCRAVLQRVGTPCPGGLLVSGPAGCGKTGLAHLLAHLVQRHPQTLTHTVIVNCQEVANDNPANVMKHLIPKIQEALDCLPSLLVLDDLHLICPSPGDSPAENPNANNSAALVEWLCDVLDSFRPPDKPALPVVVLGSCSEPEQLAAALRAPGYLDHNIALPAPGAPERASMLAAHLSAKGAKYSMADLQAVGATAEGYDAADMRVLADRALHAAACRQLAAATRHAAPGPLTVHSHDLADAQQGFQPAAAWGVGHVQGGGGGVEGWQDVGGLPDVRAALQEALELPTKYASLIARAPLRLRTGVLLYGPPGCGKTHIVSAAVAAAGMRLVSVKGPEVLNKYIGASEAAVRDLFRRAQAAAPCVMFFDEFDAIAPQRGHDSTGVTDRVVNQLLTQLDGVEGLTGVCVLAATSRPDLLDAALLRPGRLDRLIYCGFPNPAERGQILHALARRLRLHAGVNLDSIGQQCEGYSGADLSALLSEAQLAAVHESLDDSVQTTAGKLTTPQVLARHIADALSKAHPSVPPSERRRLQALYDKFANNRDPNIGSVDNKGKGKQLATLA